VNTLSRQGDRRPVIAIVGGGASGTLTALQLLRQAAAQRLDLRIDLIDRYGRHGLGQAYSTAHQAHLLNTPAGQMSALPDDPDHLIRWAGVPGEAFLPRRTYGQYLRETLAHALAQAPTVQLARISSEVTSVGRTQGSQAGRAIRLTLTDGWLEADVAVLALGAMTAGLPFEAPASSRIVGDPWQPGALDQIRDNRPVVIVGTGLTMIDLAVAISDQSPGSLIYAVSRHGLLPRSHPARPATGRAGRSSVSASRGHVRLAQLLAEVRIAVAASPERWHDVVGSIRPHVPELWRGFPDSDKRLFLRHVARYWEIHRHLMPPTTAAKLAALRESSRLEVLAGRVTDVADDVTGQFLVRITRKSQNDLDGAGVPAREITAGWIINAAGSATDVRATADPLLNDLLASGTVRPDSLGLGLDATTDGALISASGAISDTFYTLGPPLRGLWYETTAIPEIRSQAAALAARITADRRLRGQRDSAA
jgi:uncharacterized NAD(P)/FAD-binding protein YdhS